MKMGLANNVYIILGSDVEVGVGHETNFFFGAKKVRVCMVNELGG